MQKSVYMMGIIVWGMRSADRRKVNVLEMKYLKRLVEVSRMDREWMSAVF